MKKFSTLDLYFYFFVLVIQYNTINKMTDNVQQNITLDDLAGMIKRGFDENTKEHQEMRQDSKKMLQALFDLRSDHEEIVKQVR